MKAIEIFDNSERLVKLVKGQDYYIVSITSNTVEGSKLYKSKFYAKLAYATWCNYPLEIIKERYVD